MLQAIDGAPTGVVAFKAIGHVTASDYEETLQPAVDAAAADGKVRLVLELGAEFEGYTAGAAVDDFKFATAGIHDWERCALVTDHALISGAIRAFAVLMPGEIKVFPVGETEAAIAWAAGGRS